MRNIVILLLGLGISVGAQAEDVSFTRSHKMEGYVTIFKVVSPEGAKCNVKSDSSWFGEKDFEVPFKFKAQAKYYYTFDCLLPSGLRWRKKLEPKANYTSIIKIGAGEASSPAPTKVVTSGGDFEQLLKSVKEASFEDEKIRILEMAVKGTHFSVKQVGKLIDALDFSEGKIKVVELTAKKLSDPGNSYQILNHFEFEGDKKKAKELLK
ncbi:MAG: DUF4476 domain-containing protein [Deltaproteobacteria bacterium]|nr:DUF4476 domain-containing protein [Deltaproteobacteria bacterium]